jgi:hypothetical protein
MKISLSLVCLLSALSQGAPAQEIIVYGQNAPAWNKSLKVTATRGSCDGTSSNCMTQMAALMTGQNTSHFYLNLFDAPKLIGARAAEYGQQSLADPRLREIGIDDFLDHFNGWCLSPALRCGAFLQQMIESAKSKNPALLFGITVYEDQIAALLANPRLTEPLRDHVEVVHLYVHKRANGLQFETYLAQIKQAFTHAAVIGGSYPYDRLDYEKCDPSAGPCDAASARELQRQTLAIQVRLLRQGALAGLEFYPGFFGWEETWPSWNNPLVCNPARVAECIANTKEMHADVLAALGGP